MGKNNNKGGGNQKKPITEVPDKDGFVARRSHHVSGKKFSQSDGDTWQETLAVCEIANVLTIRSYFTNLRTSVRVWDEPPSGASKMIDATEEMRRMAQLQLQEMLIATGQVGANADEPSTPSKQKHTVFRSLFGRKNSNNDGDFGGSQTATSTRSKPSSASRIQYKPDSFLGKTKRAKTPKDRDMSDPALQEALAASIAEASGREHVSEATRRRARRAQTSTQEVHDLEMALAISASEAATSQHHRGRSPTARKNKSEPFRRARSRSSDGISDRSKSRSPQRSHSAHGRTNDIPGLNRATSVHSEPRKEDESKHARSKLSDGGSLRNERNVNTKATPTRNARDMSPMAPGEARYGVARNHGSSWSSVEETKMEESDHPHNDNDDHLDPMVARNEEFTEHGRKEPPSGNGSPTRSSISGSSRGATGPKSPGASRRSKSRSRPAHPTTPPSQMSTKEADDLEKALRLSELEHQQNAGRAKESTPRRRGRSSPPRASRNQREDDARKLSPPYRHSAPRRHPSREPPLRRSPQQHKRSVSAPRPTRKKPLGESNSLSPTSPPDTARSRHVRKPFTPIDQSFSPGSAKNARQWKKACESPASPTSSSSDSSSRRAHPVRLGPKPSVLSRASSAPATDARIRSHHQRRPMTIDQGQRGRQRTLTSAAAARKQTNATMLEPSKMNRNLSNATAGLHARTIKT